jgi:DHA2 family multidrug resistance protein
MFAIIPVTNTALGTLPAERVKNASGLFNLMRNLGGAIGIAACGTILNDRTNLHFLRIAEHLNATNQAMVEFVHRLNLHYTATWGDPTHAQLAAVKKLWLLAYREAQVQTFADAFLAIAACFALAVVMVPLMTKVVPPKGAPPAAH